jgi:hypothetical protein
VIHLFPSSRVKRPPRPPSELDCAQRPRRL